MPWDLAPAAVVVVPGLRTGGFSCAALLPGSLLRVWKGGVTETRAPWPRFLDLARRRVFGHASSTAVSARSATH